MKLSKRAEKALLETYRVIAGNQPALHGLVQFAAQNSGIDARNYVDPQDRLCGRMSAYLQGVRAYRAECREINTDWQRFKLALAEAAVEGVTDQEIIAAAPHAFSGRLTWHNAVSRPVGNKSYESGTIILDSNQINSASPAHWEYCTGQYFPTEYRKAATSVLEHATRELRRSRPATTAAVTTIEELKELNATNGGCWFEPSTMRFFGTRIESKILQGRYFITSEQPPHSGRKYSIRSFDDKGSVGTVGEFCAYDSKAEAMAALKELSKTA